MEGESPSPFNCIFITLCVAAELSADFAVIRDTIFTWEVLRRTDSWVHTESYFTGWSCWPGHWDSWELSRWPHGHRSLGFAALHSLGERAFLGLLLVLTQRAHRCGSPHLVYCGYPTCSLLPALASLAAKMPFLFVAEMFEGALVCWT